MREAANHQHGVAAPVDLRVVTLRSDPGTLNRIVALTELAGEYLRDEITDEAYIAAAMKLGLTRDDAICRVMILDGARAQR